jgi:hypothetical protein
VAKPGMRSDMRRFLLAGASNIRGGQSLPRLAKGARYRGRADLA